MAKRNGGGIWVFGASVVVLGLVALMVTADEGAKTGIQEGMSAEQALNIVQASCLSESQATEALLRDRTNEAAGRAMKASAQCEVDAQNALDRIPAGAWANSHCRAIIETQRDLAQWNQSVGIELMKRPSSTTPMSADDSAEGRRGLMLLEMAGHHRAMCQRVGPTGV